MDPVRPLWDVLNRLAAAVALLLLLPVLLLLAAGIRIADGKGVLFRQDRAGRNGVPFRMWKFRTMVHDAVELAAEVGLTDDVGLPPGADPRVTRLGRILRRTSLDELPQLVNVLLGQMNLVGPRPDILPQVAVYPPEARRRLEVKPGITGWAQVNGRTDIDWPERFVLDRWYVDNWSPLLDLKIMWRTAAVLNRGDSVAPAAPAGRIPAQREPDVPSRAA